MFLLVLGSIFGLPNAVINSTEFLGSFGDSRQVFIDNLSIIIYTLVNTLFLLLLSSNLKFKESEMNSKLARYNLNKVNTPRVNKFHYSLCFSLIFMYLVFMIMPDEGFNLFSLLFFVCNLAIVILLLQHMSNTNSIYEITNIFVIYQWLFLILLFILVFVLILENVLFFLIFIYAIYVGAWIVFTVESIRGMYDPYYLVEDIRSQNQLDKSSQQLVHADAKLAGYMLFEPDWREKFNLSPQDVFLSLDRLEDFFTNREHSTGKWFSAMIEKPIDGKLTSSELVKNLIYNTRMRHIGEGILTIITALFPPILVFRFFANAIKNNNFYSPPGKENINECNQLIEISKRYFNYELDKYGDLLSVGSKYSQREVLKNDGLEKFGFRKATRENWLTDYCTLRAMNNRISSLETSSIWYQKDGLVETLINRANFEDEYTKWIAWKRIDWLHDDFTSLDSQISIGKTNDNFPQFSSSSIVSNIDPSLQNWLENTYIKRDCDITSQFLSGMKKAELHAHIGGILDIESQINVGQAIWDDLEDFEKQEANKSVESLIVLAEEATEEATPWPSDWSEIVRGDDNNARKRGARAAALLTNFSSEPKRLEWCLFPSYRDRWSKRLQMTGDYFGGVEGYAGYAVPGDLMGSATLSFIGKTDAVIRRYAEGITIFAKSNNLSYLEVRLSPTKYRNEINSQIKFIQALGRSINASMDKLGFEYNWRFVISADRSKFEVEEIADEFMSNFEELLRRLKSDSSTKTWIAGYDVAGKEKTDDISGDLLKRLNSLNLELRLKSTFHAGEQADFNNLRSAYQIHTKRVGHALKLIDDEPLMNEFINSGICIEMCPTSNIEVHGYMVEPNSYYSQKGVLAKYPLREYLDSGVKVAICTDNPFISRTNLNNEIITASDLCLAQPLSFYETIKLIFNSFDNAFIDDYDKEILISEAGNQILNHIVSVYQDRINL